MRGLALVLIVLILVVGALLALWVARRRDLARSRVRELETRSRLLDEVRAEADLQITAGYADPGVIRSLITSKGTPRA